MSRSELLVLLLLVPRGPLALAQESKVPALSFLEESLHSAGRDFSQIYTGWVNSSFLYPYYLKGSTIVNDLYGSVNRTGLVIAGAALIGVSGIAFLNELNAIPNVDGVADGVKSFQGFMDGVVSRFQSSIKSGVTTFASFKPTGLDDISDRADVVYSLPGPPYNYNVDTVMNMTTGEPPPPSPPQTADRKTEQQSTEIVSIDKYFEDVDKEAGLPTLANDIDNPGLSFDQLEKPKYYADYHNEIDTEHFHTEDPWRDFEPSTPVYDPQPERQGYKKTNYLGGGPPPVFRRSKYKLPSLHQHEFYYSKPIPVNQIENPMRIRQHDTRRHVPAKPVTLNEQEYPMVTNIRNYEKFPPKKYQFSGKRSFPKSYNQKYHSFHSHKQPYTRRKPFRRKEEFYPKKYLKRGFQKFL